MDKLKKLTGILENGYGPIFWFVMGDCTISLAAKTVYAYFCSYLSSNGEDSCFPKIETITHDLKMSKDLLYKSFEELIKNDVLIIRNRSFFKNGRHTYTSNEYSLNMRPAGYDLAKINKAIVEGTIKDLGFGLIPRKVMIDESIDHEAKGVFAYYAARAGAIQEYRIDENDTRRILHLSEYQLRKYRKQLAGRYIEMKYKKADEQYPAGFVLTIITDRENKEEKVTSRKAENVDKSNDLTKTVKNKVANNPVFDEIRSVLRQETITREERVKLITDIESLHSFNIMINRTRRKDIQDFCIRRTHTLESDFTPAQRELHDSLLTFEVAALSKLHGGKGVKFMMSTIRRQAASCIFGLAPHIRDLINRRFDQLLDDPEFDMDQGDFKDVDIATFKSIAQHVLELADALPEEDPKFDGVMEIVNEKQKTDKNKIIVFSTFRHTLFYLKKKFKESGVRVEQIDGSVDNDRRLDLRFRFELPKENPDSIDILLFTEVGSEGLDYYIAVHEES